MPLTQSLAPSRVACVLSDLNLFQLHTRLLRTLPQHREITQLNPFHQNRCVLPPFAWSCDWSCSDATRAIPENLFFLPCFGEAPHPQTQPRIRGYRNQKEQTPGMDTGLCLWWNLTGFKSNICHGTLSTIWTTCKLKHWNCCDSFAVYLCMCTAGVCVNLMQKELVQLDVLQTTFRPEQIQN